MPAEQRAGLRGAPRVLAERSPRQEQQSAEKPPASTLIGKIVGGEHLGLLITALPVALVVFRVLTISHFRPATALRIIEDASMWQIGARVLVDVLPALLPVLLLVMHRQMFADRVQWAVALGVAIIFNVFFAPAAYLLVAVAWLVVSRVFRFHRTRVIPIVLVGLTLHVIVTIINPVLPAEDATISVDGVVQTYEIAVVSNSGWVSAIDGSGRYILVRDDTIADRKPCHMRSGPGLELNIADSVWAHLKNSPRYPLCEGLRTYP